MTYERERVNKTCLPDEVCVKKSMLTTLIVGGVILLAVIGVLGWQIYIDQQQLNNYVNNQSARSLPVSSQVAQQPNT